MPSISYGQTAAERVQNPPREIPADRFQGGVHPPQLRIPEQFFRHDQARDALRAGDVLSLSVIRKTVSEQYPGRIVDVRLLVPKREGINYLYNVKVLQKSGKLISVIIDAKSAKIIDVRG